MELYGNQGILVYTNVALFRSIQPGYDAFCGEFRGVLSRSRAEHVQRFLLCLLLSFTDNIVLRIGHVIDQMIF